MEQRNWYHATYPKEGAWSALLQTWTLLSKSLQAPSFGGGYVIPITVPYSLFQAQYQQKVAAQRTRKNRQLSRNEPISSLQAFNYFLRQLQLCFGNVMSRSTKEAQIFHLFFGGKKKSYFSGGMLVKKGGFVLGW